MKVSRKQKTKEDLDLSKVKVIVKVRPFVSNEVRKKCVQIDPGTAEVQLTKDSELITYSFDGAYDSSTTQEDFFTNEVAPIVDNVFKGVNTTIFAYGITGAGKTFTMQGGEGEERGIIPRVAEKVMDYIAVKQRGSDPLKGKRQYSVSLSYLEIYNEKVYDLLRPKDQDLPIREDQEKNIFIPNLAKLPVTSYEQFMDTYDLGCKNRTTAPTALNASSSRSHAVLIITVKHMDNSEGKQRKLTGKLHLIDLAGSEDNRRTENMGMRMVESTNINRSLFVLGKVVNALNDGSSRIPYRDSKLTRLLQDSLGGRSYGIMIANLSPALGHYQDTYNTLNFAAKSRKIVNKPVVNSVTTAPIVDAAERRARLLAFSQKKAAAAAKKKPSTAESDYNSEDKENTGKGNTLVNIASSRVVKRQHQSSAFKSSTQRGGSKSGVSGTDMDELIERKLERKLAHMQAQGLIGPSLRDKKVLDKEEQERLENLEKKVMALAMNAAEQKINNCFPEENEEEDEGASMESPRQRESEGEEEDEEEEVQRGKKRKTQSIKNSCATPVAPSLPVGMTPLSSAQAAMAYIKKAKKLQVAGKLKDALRVYKKAQQLIDNPRLKKKIKQLETQLANEGCSEDEGREEEESDVPAKEEEEEEESDAPMPDKNAKRKSESVVGRGGRMSQEMKKRRKVESDDEEDAQCIIKRRQDDDDDDDDEEERDRYSDDDFEPEPAKKRKASQVFSYSSPAKDQKELSRKVLATLNKGSLKELCGLHGIGKKRAEMIMAYRSTNPFTALEDLRKIGLGDKLFQTFMQRNVYEAS